jgi:uncharacterized membrane protein
MNSVSTNIPHEDLTTRHTPKFQIRDVPSTSPIKWFKLGIEDFKKSFVASFSLGLLYVLIGMFMLWLAWENPLYMATLVASFLLIGPIIAVGFYFMSHSIEKGEKPSLMQGFKALKFNSISLISFSLILAFLVGIWALVATIVTALYANSIVIGDDVLTSLLGNESFLSFVLLYLAVGGIFSVIAFSISVISVPLITNRKTDVVTAMITSVRVVTKNPIAMLSWAFLIATMIFLGMLFFYVGLAITLPIVGHASWHAYRDLVMDDNS